MALVWRVIGGSDAAPSATVRLEPLVTFQSLSGEGNGTVADEDCAVHANDNDTAPTGEVGDKDKESSLALQYERQRRKVQHAQKVGRPLPNDDDDDDTTPGAAFLTRNTVHVDEALVIVNKPSGILTSPGINHHPSLLDAVHAMYGGDLLPAQMILHRLDMDTSGLVAFGRTLTATRSLHACFRDKTVTKEYQAVVAGHWPSGIDKGIIDLPLQRDHAHPPFMRVSTPQSESNAARTLEQLKSRGPTRLVHKRPKPSITSFTVMKRYMDATTQLPVTRLLLQPHTGRTHQLRVHCAALGFPIVGDPAYGYRGEAHPGGGLDGDDGNNAHVPAFVVPTKEEEDDTTRNDNADAEAAAPKHWEVAPRCPESVLAQWDAAHPPNDRPMCLHASYLALTHPTTGNLVEFRSEPPF